MSEMRCCKQDSQMEFLFKNWFATASISGTGAEHNFFGAVAQQLVVHLLQPFKIAAQ